MCSRIKPQIPLFTTRSNAISHISLPILVIFHILLNFVTKSCPFSRFNLKRHRNEFLYILHSHPILNHYCCLGLYRLSPIRTHQVAFAFQECTRPPCTPLPHAHLTGRSHPLDSPSPLCTASGPLTKDRTAIAGCAITSGSFQSPGHSHPLSAR